MMETSYVITWNDFVLVDYQKYCFPTWSHYNRKNHIAKSGSITIFANLKSASEAVRDIKAQLRNIVSYPIYIGVEPVRYFVFSKGGKLE